MRILVVSHVGETLGHVIRALSVATELQDRGCDVHFAADPRARSVVEGRLGEAPFHPLEWRWSHNSHSPSGLRADLVAAAVASVHSVSIVMQHVRPDLVVGFPGLISTFPARKLSIPHVSVLHAPYLAPLWNSSEETDEERGVRRLAVQMTAVADDMASYFHSRLGLPRLSYEEFLSTERIFIPQPKLPLERLHEGMTMLPFIRGSYGPAFDLPLGPDTCYVTFGSGNPCDIGPIVNAAREVFPEVVVTTGSRGEIEARPGVVARPFVASSSLAGQVHTAVSHGGLGTVGTFAEHGTRQLIIPTELDQATTAVYATRTGIGRAFGLEAWVVRAKMGRELPPLQTSDVAYVLAELRMSPPPPPYDANGATALADALGV